MQNWKWTWRSPQPSWLALVLGAIVTLLITVNHLLATELTLPSSQYASTINADFNQPNYYPLVQTPPSAAYRPVGAWVGRLILPPASQYQQVTKQTQETDWAWLEVYTAPPNAKSLIGQTVRLAWVKTPTAQAYIKAASRDVRFTSAAKQAWQHGIILPIRLDNRNQVGPLQSLAGGHPYDDVIVTLKGDITLEPSPSPPSSSPPSPRLSPPPAANPPTSLPALSRPAPPTSPLPTLRINREPFQATGRFQALVKFLEPVAPKNPQDLPSQCPGSPPCTSDLIRVQHYNPVSKRFDGVQEVIRIPQQPPDHTGVYNMTTRELANSSAGQAGWYIYGAKDRAGRFTVQGMQPRSLLQIQPQQVILGLAPGLKYIDFDNWQHEADRKGTMQTVLLDATTTDPQTATADWQVGDRFLAMHLYGGRGGSGKQAEKFVFGTYAGHFSFGVGEVIQDPFTKDAIFDYSYLQVYGNGADGTMSGGNTWANYMGNLRRGILGTRPVSDVLIKLDVLTEDYNFGGIKLSFFNELLAELSLIGARYRIGNGTGDSTITSATSCVQDSSQAIFLTLQRFRKKIETNPQIIQWMKDHPTDPHTQRFRKLVGVAKDLAAELMPMGVVRWDWEENAQVLTGVRSDQSFISIDNFQLKNLATGLVSWRTAMPRQAHDEYAMLFLNHGAQLWFLRPNIIGGNDPELSPLEPTLLLGAWKLPFTNFPLLSYLVIRTFGGVTIPDGWDWLLTGLILLGFGAVMFAIGVSQGFLYWRPWQAPWYRQLGTLLRLFFIPALWQEYVFRVLLIPYPKDWIPEPIWWAWAALALSLFVSFQWLYARRQSWYRTIANPTVLLLITLFGLACTLTYRFTGSLWTITSLHWLVISVWWLLLGGKQRLSDKRDRWRVNR